MKSIWLAVSLAVLVAGCAGGGQDRVIEEPGNSLVFGYIDMADAPSTISSASIVQVSPPSKEPYWGADVHKGLIYTYHLPLGAYHLASIRGTDYRQVAYEYDLPQEESEQTRVTQPGIYFFGSYRYVNTGEAGRFELERMDTPTEAQLLERILEEDETVRGSVWEARIRKRLSELGASPPKTGPSALLARLPD